VGATSEAALVVLPGPLRLVQHLLARLAGHHVELGKVRVLADGLVTTRTSVFSLITS
jgi:hypothetical protein